MTNNTSVSVGAQAGGTIGGGYQVPEWNDDSKPITIGGSVNLALIVGVKTEGTVTVDVDPVYDATVEPVEEAIDVTKDLVNDNIVAPVQDKIVEPVKEVIVNPIKEVIVNPVKDIGNPFKKKNKKGKWF